MNAILIKNGILERVVVKGELKEMQELVGGYIERQFTVRGAGDDRRIIGYADEEARQKDNVRPNIYLHPDLRSPPDMILGPVLIMCHLGAELCDMREVELAAFRIDPRVEVPIRHGLPWQTMTIPLLTFVPGYDV